jgi:hypothetical protein
MDNRTPNLSRRDLLRAMGAGAAAIFSTQSTAGTPHAPPAKEPPSNQRTPSQQPPENIRVDDEGSNDYFISNTPITSFTRADPADFNASHFFNKLDLNPGSLNTTISYDGLTSNPQFDKAQSALAGCVIGLQGSFSFQTSGEKISCAGCWSPAWLAQCRLKSMGNLGHSFGCEWGSPSLRKWYNSTTGEKLFRRRIESLQERFAC